MIHSEHSFKMVGAPKRGLPGYFSLFIRTVSIFLWVYFNTVPARGGQTEQAKIEKDLVNFYAVHLQNCNFASDLAVPRSVSGEEYMAGTHFVLAITQDVAAVVSLGLSEGAVKIVSLPKHIVENTERVLTVVDHAIKGAHRDSNPELVSDSIVLLADLTAGEIPVFRSVWTAGHLFIVSAQAQKKHTQKVSEKMKALANRMKLADLKNEIESILHKIHGLADVKKQREYTDVIEGLIKKKAETAVYEQWVLDAVEPSIHNARVQAHRISHHEAGITLAGNPEQFEGILHAYIYGQTGKTRLYADLQDFLELNTANRLMAIPVDGGQRVLSGYEGSIDQARDRMAKTRNGLSQSHFSAWGGCYNYLKMATMAGLTLNVPPRTTPVPGTTIVPEQTQSVVAPTLPFAEKVPLPDTDISTGAKTAVILIHGNNNETRLSRKARWDTLVERLKKEQQRFGSFDFYIWYHDTSKPVGFSGTSGNAKELDRFIQTRILPFYSHKIVLVAHSRGGLVARSYMNVNGHGDHIEKLITLGTPHHGSPFAVPDWTAWVWKDMDEKLIRGADVAIETTIKNLMPLWLKIVNPTINTNLNFENLYDFLSGPGSMGLDTQRTGSVNLAWDNMDRSIPDNAIDFQYDVDIAVNGALTLSPCDANKKCLDTQRDRTRFDGSKSAHGTLFDLNQRERYYHKIIPFAAYDDFQFSPVRNAINYYLNRNKQFLEAYANEIKRNKKEHLLLKLTNLLLMRSQLESGPSFFANDGLVPLQSALLLDISGGQPFSRIENGYVNLIRENIVKQVCKDIPRYYIFNGVTDSVRDHLDLLDTTNDAYWAILFDEIEGRKAPRQNQNMILVIDKSGSMNGSKIKQAKNSTQIICNLFRQAGLLGKKQTTGHLGPYDNMALIAFDSRASLKFGLNSGLDRPALKRAISSISAGGGTRITEGLRQAERIVKNNPEASYDIILLSDGQDRSVLRSAPFLFLKGADIPIHTIGLGKDADTRTLESIAQQTSGLYYHGDILNLTHVFSNIWSQMKDENTLGMFTGLIRQGQQILYPLKIAAPSFNVLLTLSWPGSRLGLDLVNDQGVSFLKDDHIIEKGDTHIVARIPKLEADDYKVIITGEVVELKAEPFNLSVTVKKNNGVTLLPFKSEYKIGEPVEISFKADAGLSRNVSVAVESPSGDVLPLANAIDPPTRNNRITRLKFKHTGELGFYNAAFRENGRLLCTAAFRVGSVEEVYERTLDIQSRLDEIALKSRKNYAAHNWISDFNMYCASRLLYELAPALPEIGSLIPFFEHNRGGNGMNAVLEILTPFLKDSDIVSIGVCRKDKIIASTSFSRVGADLKRETRDKDKSGVLFSNGTFVLPMDKDKDLHLVFSVDLAGRYFSMHYGKSAISGANVKWGVVDELIFQNKVRILPECVARLEEKRIQLGIQFIHAEPFIDAIITNTIPWAVVTLGDRRGQVYFQKNQTNKNSESTAAGQPVYIRKTTDIKVFNKIEGHVRIYYSKDYL